MNKITSVEEVMEKLHDDMTIMIGGFCGVGAPLRCIKEITQRKIKNLTLIAIVNANPLAKGEFDLAPLFKNKQIKKFITSHNGTCPEAVELAKNGELEVEFYPMGTWIEKIRAHGAGLGGVEINGKTYLLELPLKADMAFIKGYRGDRLGNIEYRGVSLNSNTTIASAADYVVAEVNEIVEVGDIDPLKVGTPGIFVKALVKGYDLETQEKLFENLWSAGGALK